jgi:hypothetical protein
MMASEEICSDSTPDFPRKCRHFGTLNTIILHLFGLKTVETLTLRGFILIQQALNRCSKFLHFGRKLWGEFEKPTPEVPILGTVSHLDSICGVFQQTLPTSSNSLKSPFPLVLESGWLGSSEPQLLIPSRLTIPGTVWVEEGR